MTHAAANGTWTDAGWARSAETPTMFVMTMQRPIPRRVIHAGRVSAPRISAERPALSNKPSCVALMPRVRRTRRGGGPECPRSQTPRSNAGKERKEKALAAHEGEALAISERGTHRSDRTWLGGANAPDRPRGRTRRWRPSAGRPREQRRRRGASRPTPARPHARPGRRPRGVRSPLRCTALRRSWARRTDRRRRRRRWTGRGVAATTMRWAMVREEKA